jgi:hypothetical protein
MLELDLSLLAAGAYETGSFIGRAFRWLLLVAAGITLTHRLLTGSFGRGLRSRPATIVWLLLVVAGLIGSVRYDFLGDRAVQRTAGVDLTVAREEVVTGCRDQGQSVNVCECYADEVLGRTGNDPERFAALEREMVERQNAGQQPPQLIVDAAQACVPRVG